MEGSKILNRSSLLSVLLVVAIAFVSLKSALLWMESPPELTRVGKERPAPEGDDAEGAKEELRPRLVSTRNIIEKNIFDPERKPGQPGGAEASSAALQRLRGLILLGTAILGDSRYAIFQEPGDPRSAATRGQASRPSTLRLRLGDTLEGFKLSEVDAKRVVFTKGAARVEVALDFFRKVEDPRQKAPTPAPVSPAGVRKAESPAPSQAVGPTPTKTEDAPAPERATRTPQKKERRGRRVPVDLTPKAKVTPGKVLDDPIEVR